MPKKRILALLNLFLVFALQGKSQLRFPGGEELMSPSIVERLIQPLEIKGPILKIIETSEWVNDIKNNKRVKVGSEGLTEYVYNNKNKCERTTFSFIGYNKIPQKIVSTFTYDKFNNLSCVLTNGYKIKYKNIYNNSGLRTKTIMTYINLTKGYKGEVYDSIEYNFTYDSLGRLSEEKSLDFRLNSGTSSFDSGELSYSIINYNQDGIISRCDILHYDYIESLLFSKNNLECDYDSFSINYMPLKLIELNTRPRFSPEYKIIKYLCYDADENLIHVKDVRIRNINNLPIQEDLDKNFLIKKDKNRNWIENFRFKFSEGIDPVFISKRKIEYRN